MKPYTKPQSLVVIIQQQTLLATSINEGVTGNSDFYFGGAGTGDMENRTKQQTDIWNDEW